MVGSPHEAMHRIFQHDPGVFTRAVRALGLPFLDPLEVALLPTDLTETRPVERRVDTLLRISTADGVFLLLVEAQGKIDHAKPAAWAYYLSHLHAKYRLPPVLLIVCQDQLTATWARRPPAIGIPFRRSLILAPIVLGPHNVPAVTDPAEAAADIPLAALSAVTHANEPDINAILKALATALHGFDEDQSIFAELTEMGLGASPAAKTWRKLMSLDLTFFRSESSQRLRAEGHAEGHAEGVCGSILRVLDRRGIAVSEEVHDRITTCTDRDTLQTWLDRSLVVTDVQDLFHD
ncbi:hypothetical protein ABZ540_00845 [Nocardia xishanensis]|uniref:hypothetical protein n=1 Tax=Nocardia xishanensis TaxID=238964 RepID=UPI0033C7A11A